MLVVQGNYDDAIPRLQAALGWNTHLEAARYSIHVTATFSSKKLSPKINIFQTAVYIFPFSISVVK